MHGKHTGLAHTIQCAEFARLEYYLEVGVAAGFLDCHNFVEHMSEITGQEFATRNDHVDLIRAVGNGHARVFQFDRQRRLATWKCRRNRGNIDPIFVKMLTSWLPCC